RPVEPSELRFTRMSSGEGSLVLAESTRLVRCAGCKDRLHGRAIGRGFRLRLTPIKSRHASNVAGSPISGIGTQLARWPGTRGPRSKTSAAMVGKRRGDCQRTLRWELVPIRCERDVVAVERAIGCARLVAVLVLALAFVAADRGEASVEGHHGQAASLGAVL